MLDKQKNTTAIAIVIAGILIAGAILISQTDFIAFIKEKTDPLSDLKSAVANELIDPKSTEFRNIEPDKTSDTAYCGEVNAKNRMGAYIGFVQFHAKRIKTASDSQWEIIIATPDSPQLLATICPSKTASSHKSIGTTPVYYTLPEFLVRLKSADAKSSYIKTTVVLELAEADVKIIEARISEITSIVSNYLDSLSAKELSSSDGVANMRTGILNRINKAITPTHITDVMFKEIVVQ